MKIILKIICQEVFQVSLGGYLILLVAETIRSGFVSNFFDLNILLVVILVSGIGDALIV
jgi:hypothetical protein